MANFKCKKDCPEGVKPDFCIKRLDTYPSLKVSIECEQGIDFSDPDLMLTYSMWSNSKIKNAITEIEEYISFADNIGFKKVDVGDKIVFVDPRNTEICVVTGFNEENKTIQILRAQEGTTARSWTKGNVVKIFRVSNELGSIEVETDDILQIDGTIKENQVINNYLIAPWSENSTKIAGCYWLEFRLEKINNEEILWTKKFPSSKEGFLIKIIESSSPIMSALVASSSDGTHYSSDTPPVEPKVNDIWYNSTNGKLYIYYEDEDGKQWVEAS